MTNNPMRYTDPTGHMEQVDEGPGHYDNWCIQHVLKKNKPKKNHADPNTTGSVLHRKEESPVCPNCILKGVAIIATMLAVEAALGVGMIASLTPPLLPLEILLVPLETAALNVSLVGIEFIAQGQENTPDEIDIDPLPLLNPFNPDLWK